MFTSLYTFIRMGILRLGYECLYVEVCYTIGLKCGLHVSFIVYEYCILLHLCLFVFSEYGTYCYDRACRFDTPCPLTSLLYTRISLHIHTHVVNKTIVW